MGESTRHKTIAGDGMIPLERIERCILLIRGCKVLLDADLASFYQVSTKALNQAVRRNLRRFPGDFMFRLTSDEVEELNRSQIVTGSQKHRDPRYPPYAFTEQGVAMLSSVLRSDRAIEVNIVIMRAFVRLRSILATHQDLARKIADLERQFKHKTDEHARHIQEIYRVLDALMAPPPQAPKKRIGFATEWEDRVRKERKAGGRRQ